MTKVNFYPYDEITILPQKKTIGSVAYDIAVPENIQIPSGRSIIKTRFALELPEGYCAKIIGRSGYEAKGFAGYLTNTFDTECRFDCDVLLGLIDTDYVGEVGVIVKNNDRPFFIKRGQRIAQMLIEKKEQTSINVVDSISDTERGSGGFGHTGI